MKQYLEVDMKVVKLSDEDFVRCSPELDDGKVETPVIPVFRNSDF